MREKQSFNEAHEMKLADLVVLYILILAIEPNAQ